MKFHSGDSFDLPPVSHGTEPRNASVRQYRNCIEACAAMPECVVCHKTKHPRGRDPGRTNAYCDHECPGNRQDPQPGHLWPNEWREELEARAHGSEPEAAAARIAELEGALKACVHVLAVQYETRMRNGGAGQQAYDRARAALNPDRRQGE